jgi:hypothetical protein
MAKACEDFARENPIYARAMANTIKHVVMGDPLEYSIELIRRVSSHDGFTMESYRYVVSFYNIANHYELSVTIRGLHRVYLLDYGRI